MKPKVKTYTVKNVAGDVIVEDIMSASAAVKIIENFEKNDLILNRYVANSYYIIESFSESTNCDTKRKVTPKEFHAELKEVLEKTSKLMHEVELVSMSFQERTSEVVGALSDKEFAEFIKYEYFDKDFVKLLKIIKFSQKF